MSVSIDTVHTDFYTDEGFLISIQTPSHPSVGDTVVVNGKMYTVQKISWDFDVGGIPLLVRINVSD